MTLLKIASNAPSGVGPGNFQLIELGGSGANVVRERLAGGFDQCIDATGNVTTKPGNNVGPTTQGLNTRFGTYQGGGMNATDYPPDKITTEPNPGLDVASDGVTVIRKGGPANGTPVTDIDQVAYTYDDYKADMKAGSYTNPSGKAERRILALPIVDCTTMVNGHGTLPDRGNRLLLPAAEGRTEGQREFRLRRVPEAVRCFRRARPGPGPATRLGHLQDRAAQRPGEPRLMMKLHMPPRTAGRQSVAWGGCRGVRDHRSVADLRDARGSRAGACVRSLRHAFLLDPEQRPLRHGARDKRHDTASSASRTP